MSRDPLFNIASFGYFGYFFALEAYKNGKLNKLYTNLTHSRSQGIPKNKKNIHKISRAGYLLPRLNLPSNQRVNLVCAKAFDSWMSKRLIQSEIFHSFSSFGLSSIKAAKKKFNSMTIVERGSSHIKFQDEILKEEYNYWNVKYDPIIKEMIEREIAEYEEADFITVQSSFAEKTFLDQGIQKDKLIKIPLGVDLNQFKRVKKEDNVFRVFYAGNFSIRKGAMYLLRAISDLKLKNFEFVINGHISSELTDLIKPYADKIKFIGSRPFSDLYKVYSQASVLVLPTIEDGFAKVITESMACGVPVIATENCGSTDVIDNGVNGFIVPIRDHIQLMEKIQILYEDNGLRNYMAEMAYKKAHQSLSYKDHGLRAINIYEKKFRTYK